MTDKLLTVIEWVLPMSPIGKPRMTRRDKWKVRTCVDNYRAWQDQLRQAMDNTWPEPEDVYLLVIEGRWKAPKATSKRKTALLVGDPKRTVPDPDNIAKAFLDTWWKRDEGVGDILIRRRWWNTAETIIRMYLDDSILAEAGKF